MCRTQARRKRIAPLDSPGPLTGGGTPTIDSGAAGVRGRVFVQKVPWIHGSGEENTIDLDLSAWIGVREKWIVDRSDIDASDRIEIDIHQ